MSNERGTQTKGFDATAGDFSGTTSTADVEATQSKRPVLLHSSFFYIFFLSSALFDKRPNAAQCSYSYKHVILRTSYFILHTHGESCRVPCRGYSRNRSSLVWRSGVLLRIPTYKRVTSCQDAAGLLWNVFLPATWK